MTMHLARQRKSAASALCAAYAVLLALFAAVGVERAFARMLEDLPTDRNLAVISSLANPARLSVPDGEFLAPFLVPRTSGTPGNERVREFIVNSFRALGWDVEVNNFTDTTPHGPVDFANVIATKSPAAKRRLMFSAHYDSKYFPPPNEDKFIAATDSAVSCAILVDLAHSLNDLLDPEATDFTLQMVFFDGEEAFETWTDEDSIYGARHLAAKWGATFLTSADSPFSAPETLLDTIDVMVLLDLLGTSKPSIPNTQAATTDYYEALKETEASLLAADLLVTHASEIGRAPEAKVHNVTAAYETYFNDGWTGSVSDDHVPFMKRGVPIVHLINVPFSPVWHQLTDDIDAIDPVVVYNFNLIFRVFLVRYFGLESQLRESPSSN